MGLRPFNPTTDYRYECVCSDPSCQCVQQRRKVIRVAETYCSESFCQCGHVMLVTHIALGDCSVDGVGALKRRHLQVFSLDQCRNWFLDQTDPQHSQIKGHAYYTVAGLCGDGRKDDQAVKDTLWVLQKHCEIHNPVASEVFSSALSYLLSV
ncbi:hypothetical protein [Dictyobacter kobayashii]|uniref:Uncharacterized protein n=1 Tax=Dictyobacter kobayashii TaxID=2014872 RepID=A0A402ADW4_9CHLR|nr:hypothetical protein [Dictyobacter kobayashii]GCE17284.1 hypothetical protein KDK_10840 [Dictyobacter kobayashii]